MDVWEWMPFLKRRKGSIALFTLLTVVATMVVTFAIPPTYKSTATLTVQPLTQSEPLAFSSSVELAARNFGELVKSPTVEQRAAKSIKQVKLKGKPEYRVLENSGLIQATVVAGSPEQAALEANALAQTFILVNSESLQAGAENAQLGVDDQLARLRVRIKETEAALEAARKLPNGADAVTELQDKLDSLNTAYEGVLQDSQLLPSAETALATGLMLADKAVPEPKPVSPKPALNLILSIVGGLLLGIAFARFTESSSKERETRS